MCSMEHRHWKHFAHVAHQHAPTHPRNGLESKKFSSRVRRDKRVSAATLRASGPTVFRKQILSPAKANFALLIVYANTFKAAMQ